MLLCHGWRGGQFVDVKVATKFQCQRQRGQQLQSDCILATATSGGTWLTIKTRVRLKHHKTAKLPWLTMNFCGFWWLVAADGKGREGLKRNLPSQAGGRVQLVEPPPLGKRNTFSYINDKDKYILRTQSDPKDLWPLVHLITLRVMMRHDQASINTNAKIMANMKTLR